MDYKSFLVAVIVCFSGFSCDLQPTSQGSLDEDLEVSAFLLRLLNGEAPRRYTAPQSLWEEALSLPSNSAHEFIEQEMTVSREEATRWAEGFSAARGLENAHACLVIPEPLLGHPIGSYFVITTDLPACGGYEDAVRLSEDLGEDATRHFYSVSVRTFLFRHPLQLAFPGVPRWVSSGIRDALSCEGEAKPSSWYPLWGELGADEAVSFRCDGGVKVWSNPHVPGLTQGHLGHDDYIDVRFERWQKGIAAAHGEKALDSAIDDFRSKWLRFLDTRR